MSDRPLVIQTEHLDEQCAAWLAERCELVRCPSSEPGLGDLLRRADGLVIRTYTRIDGSLLASAPRLRVVGRAGVGLDNVDLAACAARRVAVVSTPAANTRAVVEYVVALVMDELRPRRALGEGPIPKVLAERPWNSMRSELIAPRQVGGMTVGVLGMGKIGSQVARAFSALDATVIYHDLREIPEGGRFGAAPVALGHLLARSEVLSVHVDGRATNRNLIAAPQLAKLREDVVLLNTSRGFVIDPAALRDFLALRPAARAILDVHEPEPFGPEYPLLGLRNARLLPHLAAATRDAHRNMSWVVRDVWRVLSGEAPEFPATPVQ